MADDITDTIWTVIDEFRGIASVASVGQPAGTLTEDGTFGCVIDPASGALVPTPRFKFVLLGPSTSIFGSDYTSAADDKIYITGIHANGPVYSLDDGNRTWGGPDASNTELMVGAYHWLEGQRSQQDTLTVTSATGGTYTITVDTMTNGVPDGVAETTDPIAYSANDAAIEAALETISFVGSSDVSVSSSVISWAGTLANQSLLVYATDSALTPSGAYATVSVSQGADDKVRSVWRKTLFRETYGNESIINSSDDTIWFANVRPRPCYFATTRSNSGQGFVVEDFGDIVPTVGPVVTLICFDGLLRMFPDDQATAAMTTRKVCKNSGGTAAEDVTLLSPSVVVGHQGRAVVTPLTLSSNGRLATYVSNEALFWSRVNDAEYLDDALSDRFLNVVLAPEDPTGYGVLASMTANELLLIKARGGALILSGSLNDYRLNQKPYVKGTGLSLNMGCASPIGYVYPVDGGGVWLFGGDKSEHISPQMDPEFWRPDYESSAFGPSHTSSTAWQEWVIFPNNWLYDTDTGTWWKLENPDRAVLHHVSADWRGEHLYATPEYVTADYSGDTPQILGYDYDINDKRQFWSARTHPIDFIRGEGTGAPTDSNRYLHLHEVVMTCSGRGRMQVDVTSEFTGQTASVTVPVANESGVDDDFPVTVRCKIPVRGTSFIFQFRSFGVGDGPAPTLHAPVRVGYRYDHQIHRDDSDALASQAEFSTEFSSEYDSLTLYS